MLVVVNTSPLIALDRIGRLDLLKQLFGRVVRTESVQAELQAGAAAYGLSDDLRQSDWIETRQDPPEAVLRKELGAGETTSIALALAQKADLVVLDDLAARLVAQELGLRVTGTLGVLLSACREGLLEDLPGALDELERAGFRISSGLRRKLDAE